MKLVTLFICFVIGFGALYSQTPQWLGVVQSGGISNVNVFSIVEDSQGNQYITGYFENQATFGSTTFQSLGYQDVFVAKLDPQGNWLWARQAGGNGLDWGCGIALDSTGNIYIAGRYSGTPMFGSNILPATQTWNHANIFAAKLDSLGNWLWASWAGGNGGNWGRSIAVAGNYCYVTGCNDNFAAFGTHPLSDKGIFAAKLDLSGNWLWASGGSCCNAMSNAVSADAEGNCYITGEFRYTASFWPTPNYGPTIYLYSTDEGYSDIFIAKIDSAGNWIWAVRAGGPGDTEFFNSGRGIGTDGAGNVYAVGDFVGAADFGPYYLVSDEILYPDIFVAKLNSAGSWLWARRAGAGGIDSGNGISVDNMGDCVITGNYQGTADFGSWLLSAGSLAAVYAAKLDSAGNWLWAVSANAVDNISSVDASGITASASGGACVAGIFSGSVTFGSHNLTSAPYYSEIFVARLGFDYPPSPSGLTATAVSSSQINLSWTDNSDNETGFKVERTFGSGRTWQEIADLEENSVSFFNAGLRPDSTYCYRVRAYNDDGASAWTSETCATTESEATETGLQWQWAVRTEGAMNDNSGYSVDLDVQGNAYVTGESLYGQAFVAKYDASGNCLWTQQPTGSGNSAGYGIAVDNSGNVLVCGAFSHNIVFGSVTLTGHDWEVPSDAFIAKLDNAGNWLWARQLSGTATVRAFSIDVDNNGNSYVVGYFEGTAYYSGGNIVSDGGYYGFVAELDANGNWLWVNRVGGNDNCWWGMDIAADAAGNSVVCGHFSSPVQLGSDTLTSSGDYDILVARLDTYGNWLWATGSGGPFEDKALCVELNALGEVYLGGSVMFPATFGPFVLVDGAAGTFVAKLDADGNWLWVNQAGGSVDCQDIAIDAADDAYLIGQLGDTSIFGSIELTPVGSSAIFVAKISDSDGGWIWVMQAGAANGSSGQGIAVSGNGSCYVTGSISGPAWFGSVFLPGNDNIDLYIAKTSGTPPDAPSGMTATTVSFNRIDLSWIDNSDNETGFTVERKTGSNGTWAEIADLGENCVFFSNSGLMSGKTYYYRVQAVSDEGVSAWSNEASATTACGIPGSTPDWLWAARQGGSSTDGGTCVAVDNYGNAYVAGYMGYGQAFVSKYDAGGNCLWTQQAGGNSNSRAYGIGLDNAGNIYICGYFWFTAIFGAHILVGDQTGEGPDAFVAKLDASGNWLWARQLGGTGWDQASGVAADAFGNCYVGGLFEGSATYLSGSLTGFGGYDVFVGKLDANGNWLWVESAGGGSYEYGEDIAVDADGNCFICGEFYDYEGLPTFGSDTLDSSGSLDIFIAKLDTEGDWIWAKRAGGIGGDRGICLALDLMGGIYLGGEFQNSASFSTTTLVSSGYSDVFVAKLDASGNWLWACQGGGTSWEECKDITVDCSGDCIVTGRIGNTSQFGSTELVSNGDSDIFAAKLDASGGNWLWAFSAGGLLDDRGEGVAVSGNGNCFVTGFFSGTADFGSSILTSNGIQDIFIAYLGAALASPEVSVTGFGADRVLSWPAVPGASYYNVYGSNDPYSSFTLLETTTATSYSYTGGENMKFFRITAYYP